jgi:putative flippase GtrA
VSAAFAAAVRRLLAPRVASRFALIGILATLLYFVLFLGADRLLSARARGWPAWPLSLGAYSVAALFSYVGHRVVSFGSTRSHALALARFVPVTIAGLLVSIVLPGVVSDWLGGPRWLAAALTCLLVPAMNALLLSWLVFPPEPDNEVRPRSTSATHAGNHGMPGGARQGLQLALCGLAVLGLALTFLSPGFLSGEGDVWKHAISDRATSLVGYYYFLDKPWSLPLFRLGNLSTPEGMSLINSDSLPLVALAGRLLRSLTGITANLYGLFMLACLILNALVPVVIARRFGVFDLVRQVAIALLFAALPFWLERYYHVSLVCHGVILLAILVYLRAGEDWSPWRAALAMAALAAAASLIHVYLWAMVMLVAGAMLARSLFSRDGLQPSRIASALALGFLALGAVWAAGYFDLRGAGENVGYMSYSMNLLSPVYSSHSGFDPRAWKLLRMAQEQQQAWVFFAGQRPDATGGQFNEGMTYLGAGALGLIGVSLFGLRKAAVPATLRRHLWLVAAAAVALLFAISPQVTIGERVFRLWTPEGGLMSLLSSFRASGRFAWLAAYLLILAAVMVTVRAYRPQVSRLLLVTAAVLQLVDSEPLRSAIRLDTSGGMKLFNEETWRPVLQDARQIVILPSFECGDEPRGTLKTVLHLMVARVGALPINSASQSRTTKDCGAELQLLDAGLRPGWVFFFFNTDPPDAVIAAFQAKHAAFCRPFAYGTVCREGSRMQYDACADPYARPVVKACNGRERP